MMAEHGIPAYYYPNTVVCIDDSKDFLMNFSLQIDASLPYRLFDLPQRALQWIKEQDSDVLLQRCFSQCEEIIGHPTTNHAIKLDLNMVQREVYNPERFNEVSVVVADYAMPSINGVQVCAELKELPLKKILLTGQADAQTAIDAFNRGIIDRFLLKSDPDVIEKINKAIAELQHQYFLEKSAFLIKALAIDSPNFLQDRAFTQAFRKLCATHHITEYYLAENTGTFLLLTASGKAHWLVVCTQQDLNMYYEIGKDLGVDPSLLEQLQTGKSLIHFWQSKHSYNIDPIEWDSYIYPAKALQGSEKYFYAFLDNPSISQLDVEGIKSYNAFLEKLDHSLISMGT